MVSKEFGHGAWSFIGKKEGWGAQENKKEEERKRGKVWEEICNSRSMFLLAVILFLQY